MSGEHSVEAPAPPLYQRVASPLHEFLAPLNRPPGPEVRLWHYLLIAIIPAVLTLLNRNWLFENGPHMDPWYYFGHFQHFPRFHNLTRVYPGERVVWILPGYVLTHLFGQVPGVIVLHVLVFLACLFAFHFIVARLTDAPTALLSTMLLGYNAYFIGPNGWDFLESESWLFLLLSIALVVPKHEKRLSLYITLSGMAWFAMIYGYVAWAVFTPAYFYLVIRLTRTNEGYWPAILRAARWFALGGVLMTLGCWGAYALMGGHGFFFAGNISSALYIGVNLKYNPWLDPQWIHQCTWLILPAVGFVVAAVAALPRLHRKPSELTVLSFHLFAFAALVLWTFRPYRILAWDYRASIMLPGLFLVFALVIFRVPRTVTRWQWLMLIAASAALSVVPLGSRYMAQHAPQLPVILGECVVLLAVVCWMLFRPGRALRWAAAVVLFSSISFALRPTSTSMAWDFTYDGYHLSSRVSRVVRLISDRLPKNEIPVFWADGYSGPLSVESRAITCAFFAQAQAMWYFPRVTLPPTESMPKPGSHIFLITEQPDILPAAFYNLAREQMPAEFLFQEHIQDGDTSYWITGLQTMAPTGTNIRRSFAPYGPGTDSPFEPPAMMRKHIVLPEAGIYQFELSGVPDGARVRFGALYPDGKTWIDESGPRIEESGTSTAWFRLSLQPQQAVELALETTHKLPNLKLTVLRDTLAANAASGFDRLVVRPYGNMLLNGGFENATADWISNNGALHTSTECYAGNCIEWSGSGKGQYLAQGWDAPLNPGKIYDCGAWLRASKPGTQNVVMGVWDRSLERWIASQTISVSPSWTYYQFRFSNVESRQGAVRFLNAANSPLALFIDNAVLLEARQPD
jgi:hypothetical protein